MRGQHGATSGYGMVFQTAEFLSMVVPKQVQQSATGSQIVRGKLCDRPVVYRCLPLKSGDWLEV